MADGVRIGGAFYEITAEAAPLIQAMAQAEARAKATSQAIAQATGLPEKAVQRYANAAIREHKRAADASAASALRIIKAHNDAAAAADKAAQAQVRSSQQTNASMLGLVKGLGGFAAAATGVTVGAATIHQAMTQIAESTQKAAQAQFALNALYGKAAPIITKQAEDLAVASGRSRTEALAAATAVANLGRQYAFTFEQQQKVLQISANLAAIKGLTLEQATSRIADALRGEAEAAEYLGQVLGNDAVKAFANMTAEQRKNFETLDPLTKAQITLGKLIGDNADLMGKATERANSAVGAYDRFTASVDNLFVSIGQRFSPATAGALGVLTGFVDKADAFVRSDFVDRLGRAAGFMAAIASLDPAAMAAAFQGLQNLPPFQVGPDPGTPGGTNFGPTSPATTAAIAEEARRQEQRIAADRKNRARADLEAADKANDATAESAIKAIDKEKRAKERWYDEERQRIEARRTYQLEDIETRRDAAIKALEEEKQAAKDAIDAQIEDQERLKDARLAAAEQAADQAKRAIDAEKERLDRVRDLEDRARDDEREAEDRAMEDARRAEDRARDVAEKAEIKRLERLRDERVAAIEDEIEQVERATEKRLRALDREADKARAASDRAMARLERRGEEEDEQHRRRMQALDDEQDARLSILDAQLKALDAQEKQADQAERTANLQKRLAEAQRAATAARGTGTPEQIAEARGELTRALRIPGNEIAIANARERLVQLAGRGNEAIREADEELAEAQAELAKESVDTARDAERDKLKAAQDAIRAEIEGRKRAEEDEDRRRKQSLERDQENERAKLASRLARLEKQKQAEQDEAKEEVRLLRNTLDMEKEAAEEQIEIARRRFADDAVILEDRRREEDRFRADQREAQDRFRADERAAEDKALKDQLDAVSRALAEERAATEAHFNGPNGTITQLKRASEDTEREYSRRLAAARVAFEEERKAAERVYTNPEGNGLLDLLAKARADEFEKLEKSKEEWREWSKSVSESIKAALADLDGFIQRGANIPGGGGGGGGRVQGEVPGGWANAARGAARSAGFSDPEAFARQIQQESGNFDPDVISGKKKSSAGAIGIAQFMPGTAKARGVDPYDPMASLIAAAKYMAEMEQKYEGFHGRKGIVNALWGYNAGEGNLQKGFLPSETLKYLRIVLQGAYGFDRGGMIREPVIGRGVRSGRPYAFAEYGPEYVVSRQATAAMIDRRPLLGPAPASNYAAMGAALASVHPGGSGGIGYQDNKVINVNGVGVDEFAARIRREEHKRHLLRGVGRGR